MGVKFAVSARKRFRKGAPEPPPAPAPEVPAADAPEHPWLGQVVRVTSDNAREQWIGLTDTVTSVWHMPDKTFSLQEGGYHELLAIHAEGSLEAQKITIFRGYDLLRCMDLAKKAAGITS